MNRVDNKHFYYSSIVEHGYTPQGLSWHSKQSQEVRFHQLLSLLPHDTRSVVDAGCGFADLYGYLRRQGRYTIRYIGLDALEVMVDEASRRISSPVYQCDILYDPLPAGEFYLCSGALNILTREAAYRFIKRCYSASTRGMIFNFLEGKKESKTFNYLQAAVLEQLGESLGARVIFRRHYYEQDCTVAFYKRKELE